MRSRFSCGFLLVLSYYVFLPISDVLLRRFFLIRGAPQTLFLLAELSFSTVSQKISATSSSYSSTFCCCFFHQLLWWLLLLLLIGAARGKRKFFTQALVVHGFFSSPLAGRRTCCRIPHPPIFLHIRGYIRHTGIRRTFPVALCRRLFRKLWCWQEIYTSCATIIVEAKHRREKRKRKMVEKKRENTLTHF